MPSEKQFVEDVAVTVEVRDASAPPKLTFSFPGLQDPVELWDELREQGWEIPERPPHPPPEIDWDSPGGSRYHVLPYQVEGFGVHAHEWPSFEVAERGLETINVLRRFGVDLHVPVAYLAFLRRTQVALMKDPSRARVKERPTKIPHTLLLSKQPFSVLVDEKSIDVYETAADPNQPRWYWSESTRPAEELCNSDEARSALLSTVELGWELMSRLEALPALDGRDRILRFVVRDVSVGTAMLDLLKSNVGDHCASLLMRPIARTGAFENCLLIVAVVPKERFAEIGETLIKAFPDAIGRGRRYTPVSEENAA